MGFPDRSRRRACDEPDSEGGKRVEQVLACLAAGKEMQSARILRTWHSRSGHTIRGVFVRRSSSICRSGPGGRFVRFLESFTFSLETRRRFPWTSQWKRWARLRRRLRARASSISSREITIYPVNARFYLVVGDLHPTIRALPPGGSVAATRQRRGPSSSCRSRSASCYSDATACAPRLFSAVTAATFHTRLVLPVRCSRRRETKGRPAARRGADGRPRSRR